MARRDNSHVEEFLTALQVWTDERFISRQQLHDVAMFSVYLVNLADSDGWSYDGHSLTVGETMSRLVVRGTINGTPHVVFSSGRTTTACIRAFLRKMDEGWLEWSVDKFRT